MNNQISNLGILAFGSLINNPGVELENIIVKRIKNVQTPFRVEYARKSKKRGNAPTLIPVKKGGAKVLATLLVMSDKIDINEVQNMLYRRELNIVGSDKKYVKKELQTPNHLVIGEHKNIQNVRNVLTVNFGSNLKEVTPEILANLAIESYKSINVARGRDGITYLYENILNGIVTPLTEDYENYILQKMNAKSLAEILKK